jgi:Ca-activated chloride channel family protein
VSSTQASFAPVAASTGEQVHLAMQRLLLTGQVLPAGARLIVQHIFRSEEEKPLEVIYSFPLPRDAALRRFRITGEGFEAHSELKETEDAVKAYEDGIAQGSLSTLARQYGDGVINLTVGNIRPKETVTVWLEIVAGVELKDDGFRFRFPFALAPRYHGGAKAASFAPGEGEMELPGSEFGDVILPRFREDPSALHQIGFDLAMSSGLEFDEIGSPSHPVRVKQEDSRGAHVSLATGGDVPNRDLVLDGRFKAVERQVLAGRDANGVGRFAAVIPSTSFGAIREAPKRIVILLDRSGSMGGAPIAQARKAIEACLGVLSDADSFGLVAFDNTAEVFHPTLLPATREVRDTSRDFLNHVDARGGTDLVSGFLAAVNVLGGGGGDILIMTDGQVAGTETILESARKTGVRLHCLGIGSASQDRFLTLLARETGGVSRFVTPRERVDLSAVDLFASIGSPVATGLKVSGSIQPQPASTVFTGTPVILFGEGDEPVELTWDTGRMSVPVGFNDSAVAETVWLLQGSRLITDWESRYPASEALAPLEKRKENRVAMRLRELSRTYGLASREMSLIAVVKRAGDRTGELPETKVVPVGMTQDTQFGAYFTSAMRSVPVQASVPMMALMSPAPSRVGQAGSMMADALRRTVKALFSSDEPLASADAASDFLAAPPPPPRSPTPEAMAPANVLFDLAARMESDGGMPGRDPESRARASLLALLAFLSQGHTPSNGAFRLHVAKLLNFLKSVHGLPRDRQELLEWIVAKAEKGQSPAGDWLTLASVAGDSWSELTKGVLRSGNAEKL